MSSKPRFYSGGIDLNHYNNNLKCYKKVLDIPTPFSDSTSMDFCYDEEWLAIIRATNDYFSREKEQKSLPPDEDIQKYILKFFIPRLLFF